MFGKIFSKRTIGALFPTGVIVRGVVSGKAFSTNRTMEFPVGLAISSNAETLRKLKCDFT